MSQKSDEVRILELALQKMTEQMNALLEDCTSPSEGGKPGAPKAPSRQVYMKARACLPKAYSMALK